MVRIIVFASLLIVISADLVFADEVKIDPVGDAYVHSGNPDTNYGGSPVLYVGETQDGDFLESLLMFDLPEVLDGATVDYGYLVLWCNLRYGTPGDNLRCDDANADWEEMTVTWNTAPDFFGDIVPAPWPDDGDPVSFEVTEWVQDWIDGVRVNRGFLVYRFDTGGYCYANLDSRESSDTDERPFLYVIYTSSAVEGTSLGKIKAAFE
jgi:hypothetical protein